MKKTSVCLRQTCRPSRQIDRHNESETEKEGIHGERNDGALPEGSRHPELSNNKLTGTSGLEGSAVPGIVMQPAFQKIKPKPILPQLSKMCYSVHTTLYTLDLCDIFKRPQIGRGEK